MKFRQTISLFAALTMTLALPSCRSAKVKASAESARLRLEVTQLNETILDLERRNKQLAAEIQGSQPSGDGLAAEIRSNIPHVVEIAVSRLSFARDTNGDGRPDSLTLYVEPTDGRGRFEQMVGTLNITAALIEAQGDPIIVGRQFVSVSDLTEAYRYSFTGIHYAINVPLQWPETTVPGEGGSQMLATVTYIDGQTEVELTAHRMIPFKR